VRRILYEMLRGRVMATFPDRFDSLCRNQVRFIGYGGRAPRKVQECRRGIYSVTMGVIPILQGLLTPVIAIITTYIAWQQWQGNKQKLKMDGYERRLRVYQEVVKMLKTCANGQIREFSVILDFGAATAEADFLFGPEIRQYLDEISTRAAKLRSANVQYRDFTQPVPENYDHEKIVNEMTTQTAWFVEQLVGFVAKNKFGQYLNISEVKAGDVMNRARQIVLALYWQFTA
jgi:hypothetical protein